MPGDTTCFSVDWFIAQDFKAFSLQLIEYTLKELDLLKMINNHEYKSKIGLVVNKIKDLEDGSDRDKFLVDVIKQICLSEENENKLKKLIDCIDSYTSCDRIKKIIENQFSKSNNDKDREDYKKILDLFSKKEMRRVSNIFIIIFRRRNASGLFWFVVSDYGIYASSEDWRPDVSDDEKVVQKIKEEVGKYLINSPVETVEVITTLEQAAEIEFEKLSLDTPYRSGRISSFPNCFFYRDIHYILENNEKDLTSPPLIKKIEDYEQLRSGNFSDCNYTYLYKTFDSGEWKLNFKKEVEKKEEYEEILKKLRYVPFFCLHDNKIGEWIFKQKNLSLSGTRDLYDHLEHNDEERLVLYYERQQLPVKVQYFIRQHYVYFDPKEPSFHSF